MNPFGLLDEARQIDQSKPDYLVGVAAAWDKIAAELNQKPLVTRSLNRVSDAWASQRIPAANYATEVSAGMDAMLGGVTEVAAALRAAIPVLQDLKSRLNTALVALGASVGALVYPPAAVIGGGISVGLIVDLVNEYYKTMAILSGALGQAQEMFDALSTLHTGGGPVGGIIPAPPDLPETPD